MSLLAYPVRLVAGETYDQSTLTEQLIVAAPRSTNFQSGEEEKQREEKREEKQREYGREIHSFLLLDKLMLAFET